MDRVKGYIRLKSVERKGYRPLSPGPLSPPSPASSKEKMRYWECPGGKASKSPTCSSSTSSKSSKYKSEGIAFRVTSANAFYSLLKKRIVVKKVFCSLFPESAASDVRATDRI